MVDQPKGRTKIVIEQVINGKYNVSLTWHPGNTPHQHPPNKKRNTNDPKRNPWTWTQSQEKNSSSVTVGTQHKHKEWSTTSTLLTWQEDKIQDLSWMWSSTLWVMHITRKISISSGTPNQKGSYSIKEDQTDGDLSSNSVPGCNSDDPRYNPDERYGW